jgi:hypothetical protein
MTTEHQLPGSKLFEILKTHDSNTDVIIRTTNLKAPDLPMVTMTELDNTEVWETLFEPSSMFSFFIRTSSIVAFICFTILILYCCCPKQTKACCSRMSKSDTRKTVKRRKQYQEIDSDEDQKREEQRQEQEILLNRLSNQLDELSKSPHTSHKRWPSIPHFVQPILKSRSTSQNELKNDTDEVDIPIPPPIGSPHLSYKLKDIECGHSSVKSSPTIKRVQFE